MAAVVKRIHYDIYSVAVSGTLLLLYSNDLPRSTSLLYTCLMNLFHGPLLTDSTIH
jgi:hypothetical protein